MHRAPQEILSNNIGRAQFIVPLQSNYNQQFQNYYKIIYNILLYFYTLNAVRSTLNKYYLFPLPWRERVRVRGKN